MRRRRRGGMTGGEMGKPSTSLQNKKIMEDILVLSPVDWGRIPRLAVLGFESHFGDCLILPTASFMFLQ